jgi:hypothetical protein
LGAIRLQPEAGITPAGVCTYGSARAGNTSFAEDYAARIARDSRFENRDDLLPHLPPTVTLLSFLAQVDSRLAGLAAHGYQHVGLLEFLDWNGAIDEGSSLALDANRLLHFAELAAIGKIVKVAQDHSLEKQYIPKLVNSG